MFYLVKTPWWLKKLYPECVWEMPATEKTLYLSFDDGPHQEATPFVLEELRKYNAKASFFCIGKNVKEHQALYQRILDEGHKAGNHTFDHLNGWKTGDQKYFENVAEARKFIDSDLFRPPYGRITKFQLKYLRASLGMKTIMWSCLSADFDTKISPRDCLQNVLLTAVEGSIIVFHDSGKAWDRMRYALPIVLEHFSELGYKFARIG
jgi:peptidoglycan/xylan/chitin deacetylase (PgdA/CDA1 family)